MASLLAKITMGSPRRLLTTGGDSGSEGGPNNMEGIKYNEEQHNYKNNEKTTKKINDGNMVNPFARGGLSRSPPKQTQEEDMEQHNLQQQMSREHGQGVIPEQQLRNEVNLENPFARSDLSRLPPTSLEPEAAAEAEPQIPSGCGLNVVPQKPKVVVAKRLAEELHNFVDNKSNVHKEIKLMITRMRKALASAVQEYETAVARAEIAECALGTAKASLAASHEKQTIKKQVRLENTPVSMTPKRGRTSPGDGRPGGPKKKTRQDAKVANPRGETRGSSDNVDATTQEGWNIVVGRKGKKNQQMRKQVKKIEPNRKEKPPPRRKPPKTDAVLVKANDATTYAALLKRVREDPELRDLGDNVVKARRTQKGEMLFELKKDPTVDSMAIQERMARSLGQEAEVKVLCPEMVIVCKDLDEITTEEELRHALQTQCNLGEVQMTIRLRKVYGNTQTAIIRLPVTAADKALEVGKVGIGWSKCPLTVAPPVNRQAERCFKCWGFGHRVLACRGPDRSKMCWNCGEVGHLARDCTQRPKCMICTQEDGNDHRTGSSRCPAYKRTETGEQ